MKTCSRCNKEKPFDEFYVKKRQWYHSQCKICFSISWKERRMNVNTFIEPIYYKKKTVLIKNKDIPLMTTSHIEVKQNEYWKKWNIVEAWPHPIINNLYNYNRYR